MYIASDVTKDLVTDEFPDKYEKLPKIAPLFCAVTLIGIGRTFRTLSNYKDRLLSCLKVFNSVQRICNFLMTFRTSC
jgi:hypothetical protein